MKIKILATQWGSEDWTASQFVDFVLQHHYDGVEINMPDNKDYISDFQNKLNAVRQKKDFRFVGQAVLGFQKESFSAHRLRYKKRLEDLIQLQPDFINVQTGADYFSFEENCKMIETASELSQQSKVKIYHETHRGKFSFHSLKTLAYLEKFPEMELTADFSHWCTVSETMLDGQEDILKQIFPRVRHIHARVGFAQAPQVNHFQAPEWQTTTQKFIYWWQQILATNSQQREFTFLTEFGPKPYLPYLPFSNVPVANQWELNLAMKRLLEKEFIQ